MAVKIGELAKLADCQVVTIRYYEKEGLLAEPSRTSGGYRLYGQEDIDRLKFIRHCRDHGMALADIKTLLSLRSAPGGDCSAVGQLVDRHIDEVERQIESLELLKSQLLRLRNKCPSGGDITSCGILKSLTDRSICGCRAEHPPDEEQGGN